jgi:hypothetical protein
MLYGRRRRQDRDAWRWRRRDRQGDFLLIRRGERVNIDANYTHTDAITEAQRAMATNGDGRNTTLQPASEKLVLTGTWAKPLSHIWLATLNAEVTATDSEALRRAVGARCHPCRHALQLRQHRQQFLPRHQRFFRAAQHHQQRNGPRRADAERHHAQLAIHDGGQLRSRLHPLDLRPPAGPTAYAADVAAGVGAADPRCRWRCNIW